ncbi:ABC transporter ATP-binding protein [Hominifimenecus sp. rT4P-3]|uniref:ABC transporter ATP-binding protein n=1 Tax=Hominifimenecus sp. rT4P-3 TaxID=3242979 RepID=UPI003DA2BA14
MAEHRDEVLKIEDLSIQYITKERTVHAVNDVSLSLKRGETMGLVGETGAGKTTIALGILQLIPDPPGKIMGGKIFFEGDNLLEKKLSDMQKIRGNKISMIFQDPMTALNPIEYIGDQIAESIALHKDVSKKEAQRLAANTLEKVGIPRERYFEYPHQFSGGMKQRIVIAIALACNPELLIADEPTTALDVTIQAQVLDMMNDLKRELGTAMLLITHDLGVVAEMCDRVSIIYAGEIVETGTVAHIFNEYMHPYTEGLFASLPRLAGKEKRLKAIRGLMPDPADLPKGCKFAPRCPYAKEACSRQEISLKEVSQGHFYRCLFGEEVAEKREADRKKMGR